MNDSLFSQMVNLGTEKLVSASHDAARTQQEAKVPDFSVDSVSDQQKKLLEDTTSALCPKTLDFPVAADAVVVPVTAKEAKMVRVADSPINRLYGPSHIGCVFEAGGQPAGLECVPVTEAADEDEDGEDTPGGSAGCPSCGGQVGELGSLGNSTWYRCRDCGIDFRSDRRGSVGESVNEMAAANMDVAKMFIDDSFPKDKKPVWGSAHLKITKQPNGWSLVNYFTPILYRANGSDEILFNRDKYSVTTSKIQNQLAGLLAGYKVKITTEDGIKSAIESPAAAPSPENSDPTRPVMVEAKDDVLIKPEGDKAEKTPEHKFTGAYGVSKKAKPVTDKI